MIPALTSVRGRRGRQLLDSPYIINGIISTTLLTKQMHKSHRHESIGTETFNHVLNNDYCSHNAIIIFSSWYEWMCCQGERRHEAGVIRQTEPWLTPAEEKTATRVSGGIFMWSGRLKVAVKMQWIFAVLFISWLPLNKSGGTCIACPSAFSSAP